ncbi:MAG: transposase [Verrucomicrobia bacterium]|nr:transposase [Leptolyngbya sp. ES-bin-22]
MSVYHQSEQGHHRVTQRTVEVFDCLAGIAQDWLGLRRLYENPEDLLGEGGILKQLTKVLVERCLEAEMTTHIEEQRQQSSTTGVVERNRRNGHSKKTIKGEVERWKP